jgi:4-amino-4-deoxy-L-arabinose transferase-like glycosyltransferase
MIQDPAQQTVNRLLMCILLLAAVVRIGFLIKNWNDLDFSQSFMLHGEIARNILDGHWMQKDTLYLSQYTRDCLEQKTLIDFEDYPPPQHESLVPVYNDEGGYGSLVALTWSIFGSNRWWFVRVIQIMIDIMMCWLVYRIGSTAFGKVVGLVSSFAYALFIPGVELAVRPHRDIWVTFLFILTVYLLIRNFRSEEKWRRYVAIGVSSAVVAMMRSTTVPFIVFLSLVFLVVKPKKGFIFASCVLVVSFLVAFSPLLVRNYVVFHKIMATRGAFWHSFWGGVGQMPNPYGVKEEDTDIARFALTLDPSAKFETEQYEQALRGEAVKLVTQHPGWYATSVARRAFFFLFPKIGRELFFQQVPEQNKVGVINTAFPPWLPMLFEALITVLFLFGCWVVRREWKMLLLILAPYVFTLCSLAPFYVTGRNIANVYFVVLLLASVGMVWLWGRTGVGAYLRTRT